MATLQVTASAACNALSVRSSSGADASTISAPSLSAASKPLLHCATSRRSQRSAIVKAAGDNAAAAAVEKVAVAEEEETVDTSAFISEVASLIKLVDSRDIVELELKHKNIELLIRKEVPPAAPAASTAPAGYQTFPGPHVMAHTAFPYPPPPPVQVAAPAPAPAAEAPAPPPPAAEPAPAAPVAASLPAMLSPMAGTFYRSPAPGEPAFVKVGDRVTKGQVVCIIEAMKLMNEIEADQSGEVVEIIAADGKPVSIESPLLRIKP